MIILRHSKNQLCNIADTKRETTAGLLKDNENQTKLTEQESRALEVYLEDGKKS